MKPKQADLGTAFVIFVILIAIMPIFPFAAFGAVWLGIYIAKNLFK